MKRILALFRKDWSLFWADRTGVFMTFMVPAIIIYLLGNIFGGSQSGPSGIKIAIIDESQGEFSAKLIEAFSQEQAFSVVTEWTDNKEQTHLIDETQAREHIRANRYRYALILSDRSTPGE
jgi:hypothetical protein